MTFLGVFIFLGFSSHQPTSSEPSEESLVETRAKTFQAIYKAI